MYIHNNKYLSLFVLSVPANCSSKCVLYVNVWHECVCLLPSEIYLKTIHDLVFFELFAYKRYRTVTPTCIKMLAAKHISKVLCM